MKLGFTTFVLLAVLLLTSCETAQTGSTAESGRWVGATRSKASSPSREFRGAWVYDPRLFDPDEVVRTLKDAGFNAVFVRLSSAGAAYYPSSVLPTAPGTDQDFAAAYVAAGRKYGLQIHAWHVCFMMHYAPRSEVETAIKTGKVMRDAKGRALRPTYNVPVRTPALASNRELEQRAMVELVSKYDLSGVQFDYIRYFSANVDYCASSRAAFEQAKGIKVKNWPSDVTRGKYRETYHRWRTDLISSVVRDVSVAVRRANPAVKVSAAVWHSPDVALDEYAQDWLSWVEDGYLDFVVPMNYTTDNNQFVRWLEKQRRLVNGRVPIYAGIGSYLLDRPSQMNQQIALCRDAGMSGYVLYNYDQVRHTGFLTEIAN